MGTEKERSGEFEVQVRVHQYSVLSPLLLATVIDEITKDVKESGVKELLHADDLVLLRDSREETEMRYAQWKKATTEKGMKVNVKKTMAFCTDERTVAMETSKFSCSVSRMSCWKKLPFYTSNVTVGCIKCYGFTTSTIY